MAATFSAFARAQSRRVIILVELTPGLLLAGWTKTGGRTFVYQIALSAFVMGGGPFGPGVYRKCVGLQENSSTLTAVGSVATCDAVASTFFWDEANGILYAHSSTGSSPDLFTAYMALVRFYVANEGIVINLTDGNPGTGVYYRPWITGGHDEITQRVEDLLAGIKVTETAEIALTNGHKFWFPIIASNGNYVWKNKTFKLLVGGSYDGGNVLPYSQYASWSTLQIEDVACDEDQVTFTLKPLVKVTERTLPVTPFFPSDYPNLGEGVSGTKKALIYGRIVCRPDLTDTSGNGVYTIADAAFQTLFAVNQVVAINKTTRARTSLSVGSDYTVNLTACTLTIVNATYIWSAYELETDVTGKPDGAGSYHKTFADIVKDILFTFLGVTAAQIDTSAFARAKIDAPQELAVYMKSPRQIASIFDSDSTLPSLEKSVMGTVQQTLAGLWTCWIWKPGVNPATALSLRKEDLRKFNAVPKLETVYGTTRVYYGYNAARDTWDAREFVDAKTRATANTTDEFELRTFLRSSSDAIVLAQRYQLIAGSVSLEVEFEERGAILATAQAGDRLLVTYDPAPDVSGKFDSYPMELIEITRSLVPVLAMSGRLGDLRGIGARVGTWQNVGGGGVAWSAASTLQRQNYGFWTDANGYIVPGDESTRHQKVWW